MCNPCPRTLLLPMSPTAQSVIRDFISAETAVLVEPDEKPLGIDRKVGVPLRSKCVDKIAVAALKVGRVARRPEDVLQFGTRATWEDVLDDVREHFLAGRDVTLYILS